MACGYGPACATKLLRTTSRKCCAGSIPATTLRGADRDRFSSRKGMFRVHRNMPDGQNQLIKLQTTHCFPAISDYIAPQRVRCARSFWPGFLFGRRAPFEFQVSERDPEEWVPVF